jgi:DNA polymerase-3 subunit beta
MNITVVRESFVETLQQAGHFVSNKISDLKFFKGVLINATQRGVVVQTTNINDYFSGEIGGKVAKTGEVLVDFKTLFEIVKNLNDTSLTLEKLTGQLVITSRSGKVKLSTLDSVNFPQPSPEKAGISLPLSLFEEKTLQPVLLSCATDEARPILTGVCLDFEPEEVKIVGTDGFRMSVFKISQKTTGPLVGQKIIISSKSLNSILHVFKTPPPKIVFHSQEKKLIFQGEGILISTRLLEGEFPPYLKVIPQNKETCLEIKKSELLEAVKSSSLFAREGSNMLTLEIKGSNITISSAGAGVGEAVFNVEALKTTGSSNKIVFNYRYLLEFLSNIEAETLVFEMVSAFTPGVFKIKNKEGYLHIIMPIRSEG